jgi:hypothetical protein
MESRWIAGLKRFRLRNDYIPPSDDLTQPRASFVRRLAQPLGDRGNDFPVNFIDGMVAFNEDDAGGFAGGDLGVFLPDAAVEGIRFGFKAAFFEALCRAAPDLVKWRPSAGSCWPASYAGRKQWQYKSKGCIWTSLPATTRPTIPNLRSSQEVARLVAEEPQRVTLPGQKARSSLFVAT